MSHELATRIVDAILEDLMDRRRLKVPFLELQVEDEEMFALMREQLIELVAFFTERTREVVDPASEPKP